MVKLITFVMVLFGIVLTLEFITIAPITFPLKVDSDLVVRGIVCIALEVAKAMLFYIVGLVVTENKKLNNQLK